MSQSMQIGSWSLLAIPPGWEVLHGYGIRRIGQNVFPSVLMMVEEKLPEGSTLPGYVANQIEAIKGLLREPKFKGPVPVAMPEASEAQRLGVSYNLDDGRAVVQIQIYATAADIVGNATFTTLEEELPTISNTLQALIKNLRFQPPYGESPA
jgi:hypothetical protein